MPPLAAIVGGTLLGGALGAAEVGGLTLAEGLGLGIAGGSALGSVMSGNQAADVAQQAAQTQAQAADKATQAQLEMFYQTRKDQLPWLEAGQRALAPLEEKIKAGPGTYERSPDYAALKRAGEENINALVGSRGQYFSGAAAKELASFNKDLASMDYDRWLNRWYQSLGPYQSMAGVGQTTAGNMASNALTTGQLVGQNTIAGGNALAQGQIGASNAMTQGYQGAANLIGAALPYAFSGTGGSIPYASTLNYTTPNFNNTGMNYNQWLNTFGLANQ